MSTKFDTTEYGGTLSKTKNKVGTLSQTKKNRLTGLTAFGLRGGYSEKKKQLFLSLSKFNINFEVIARLWSQRVLRRLNANPS